MKTPIAERLSKLYTEGEDVSNERGIELWFAKALQFLKVAIGLGEADDFARLIGNDSWEQHALRLGHLQGLVARIDDQYFQVMPSAFIAAATANIADVGAPAPDSKKVFLVHGHDNEAKETAARFLEKLGLHPIILHEQPNSGRTIIEKFEVYSGDIAFAVVLLTPDDFGGTASTPTTTKPRARQNVIMELGYFIGKLGRFRVCALHKGGVELPSDYQGVLYVELDPPGAWKAKLAQEFVQAKLTIDLSGLVRS
jgi:predicted nucleotide-binding protein